MAASQDIILYTCITNNRDIPKTITCRNNFGYVMFSDLNNIRSDDWDVRPVVWQHPTDPIRTARYHKHHPHILFPDCQISIWLDATHWPYKDLTPILGFVKKSPIAAMRHFSRTTIDSEAKTIIEAKMDDEDVIARQMDKYTKEGFLDHYGLFSTTCLVRKHGPDLTNLQELWWSEIENGSRRDQLSFTYCLWKLGVDCEILPGLCRGEQNPFFKMVSHYKSPSLKML